jgi:hypothetical protein
MARRHDGEPTRPPPRRVVDGRDLLLDQVGSGQSGRVYEARDHAAPPVLTDSLLCSPRLPPPPRVPNPMDAIGRSLIVQDARMRSQPHLTFWQSIAHKLGLRQIRSRTKVPASQG